MNQLATIAVAKVVTTTAQWNDITMIISSRDVASQIFYISGAYTTSDNALRY